MRRYTYIILGPQYTSFAKTTKYYRISYILYLERWDYFTNISVKTIRTYIYKYKIPNKYLICINTRDKISKLNVTKYGDYCTILLFEKAD